MIKIKKGEKMQIKKNLLCCATIFCMTLEINSMQTPNAYQWFSKYEEENPTKPESPYNALGLNQNATIEEIQKQGRQESRKWHSDKFINKTEEEKAYAKKMLDKINLAKDILSNPTEKAYYDKGIFNYKLEQLLQGGGTEAEKESFVASLLQIIENDQAKKYESEKNRALQAIYAISYFFFNTMKNQEKGNKYKQLGINTAQRWGIDSSLFNNLNNQQQQYQDQQQYQQVVYLNNLIAIAYQQTDINQKILAINTAWKYLIQIQNNALPFQKQAALDLKTYQCNYNLRLIEENIKIKDFSTVNMLLNLVNFQIDEAYLAAQKWGFTEYASRFQQLKTNLAQYIERENQKAHEQETSKIKEKEVAEQEKKALKKLKNEKKAQKLAQKKRHEEAIKAEQEKLQKLLEQKRREIEKQELERKQEAERLKTQERISQEKVALEITRQKGEREQQKQPAPPTTQEPIKEPQKEHLQKALQELHQRLTLLWYALT